MKFCQRCAQLEITPESFFVLADGEKPCHRHKCGVSLKPLECDICHLTSELLEATVLRGTSRNATDDDLRICISGSYTEVETHAGLRIQPRIALDFDDLDLVGGILPAAKNTTKYPYFSRLLPQTPSFLDFDLIRHWIARCETQHPHCRQRSASESDISNEGLLVIDVLHKCLVPAPETCRYIALSYVWGNATQVQLRKDNLLELSRKDSLSDARIPATIRDAMTLVEKLGERYLWVDALCIVSDDAAIRQAAISNMDNIYSGSILTIVAGTCNSADDALRGVSTKRHCKQVTREISPEVTLLAYFDVEYFFRKTTYCKRAWTFQEFQLAPRLLVFAPNDQVYFLCDEASYTEDGPEEYEPQYASDRLRVSKEKAEFTFSLKRRIRGHLPHTNYRWALSKYNRLKITKNEDILDALSGVIKRIGVGECFQGLPVDYFDHALFWQGSRLKKRRQEFPSWTWAGWSGGLTYVSEELDYVHLHGDAERYPNDEHREWVHKASEMELMQLYLKHATWIVYYVWDNQNSGHEPRWLRGGRPNDGVSSATEAHEARFPGLPCNTLPFKSYRHSFDQTPLAIRTKLPLLHFWTVSVYYEVRHNTEGRGGELLDSESNPVGSCDFDRRPDLEDVDTPRSCHEFIVIYEEGDLSYERWRSSSYIPSKKYRVIMIEWNGDIAERIGSGYLQLEGVFKSCRRPMKWKEIVIG